MTVICWDGKTLAADKRTSFGGLHATTTKAHRLPDGRLFGGCGPTAVIKEMQHWISSGADPATFPSAQRSKADNCSALVVQLDGTLIQYEETPYPLVIQNRQWAIGNGRDFAIMAMHLGKTAEEAVLLTAEFCSDCGNGVDALQLVQAGLSCAHRRMKSIMPSPSYRDPLGQCTLQCLDCGARGSAGLPAEIWL